MQSEFRIKWARKISKHNSIPVNTNLATAIAIRYFLCSIDLTCFFYILIHTLKHNTMKNKMESDEWYNPVVFSVADAAHFAYSYAK